jgi:hypothetical protein
MLSECTVTTMLPVKDVQRARASTRASSASEGPQPDGKFLYRCGGGLLALFPKEGGTKADHTALSFEVRDIATASASCSRPAWCSRTTTCRA